MQYCTRQYEHVLPVGRDIWKTVYANLIKHCATGEEELLIYVSQKTAEFKQTT